MIGKIKGKLIDIEGNKGLIETASGLSYEVFLVPTIIKNNILGKSLELFTQLIVREDSQTLYGFVDKSEINIFNGYKVLSIMENVLPLDALRGNDGNSILNYISYIKKMSEFVARSQLLQQSGAISK